MALGNELNNVIDASQVSNSVFIDGGAGADTMIGGVQSNIYVVNNVGDVIQDAVSAAGARNQVVTSVNYTLSSGLQELFVADVYANYVPIVGTGNGADNILDSVNLDLVRLSDGTYASFGNGDTLVGLGARSRFTLASLWPGYAHWSEGKRMSGAPS